MILATKNGTVYQLKFPYDPVLVDAVKQLPSRTWDKDLKIWIVPSYAMESFIEILKALGREDELYCDGLDHLIGNSMKPLTEEYVTPIPDISLDKVHFYVNQAFQPYKHQLDFMKFAIGRQLSGNMHGFLLGDEQGCGKTLESMNLAIYNRKKYRFNHCLIICCVASSKYNWYNDIIFHTNGQGHPYILGSRKRRDGSLRCDMGSAEKYEDLQTMKKLGKADGEDLPYFLILNIEAIRYKVGRTYPIADRIIELINEGQINMIIIDEIHKNCSPSSMQGKQILRIKNRTGDKCMYVPVTGTPITKSPLDAFTSMRLIDAHNYTSFYKWSHDFCIYGGFGGHEIVGYKNIESIKNMIQGNMIRRRKKDVPGLPPKIYYTEYVENTPVQKRLYSSIENDLISMKDEIIDTINPLSRFLRLRQVNGSPELIDGTIKVDKQYLSKNAKFERALELLADAQGRGEKTVVFSNWVEPLRTLYRLIAKKYKVCCFTGTMTGEDREKNKKLFQEDPNYTVLIGTIGAAGTTHTFTAANNIIFLDEPWNPSDKVQAEDRCHRIGTSSSVNIFTILTRDTVDDRVHDILYTKEGISQYVVDSKLDFRMHPELFDLLLHKTH